MSVQLYLWNAANETIETGSHQQLSEVIPLWQRTLSEHNSDCIWIDLSQPSPEDLALLESSFGIDAAAIRDLQTDSSLPRMHSFKTYDYVLLHRLFYSFEKQHCEHRGLGVFRGKRFLITVHQNNLSRLLEYIGNLALSHPEAFMAKGNSRLFLHLLEGLVADYGPIVHQWQEELEEIEESILRGSQAPVIERILRFKKLVVTMRKALIPQRQTLVQVYERSHLQESEEYVRQFLKNVSEELSSLLRELEGLSTQSASVFEIYAANLTLDMSKSSHQLNITMQRLSVMSAIFMPLTFIVGVYGMNIEGIPELHWPNFYFFLWGAMVVIVGLLLYFFKKMKWY